FEVARGDQELHRLLARIIATRAGQRNVGAGKKLAAGEKPLQERNPKSTVGDLAFLLARFAEGPAPEAAGVQAERLALAVPLVGNEHGPIGFFGGSGERDGER